MRILKADLKFAVVAAAAAGLPLFFIFGALWNPHGSTESVPLHYVGLVGIAPLLYIAELLAPGLGFAAFLLACAVQFFWFALWALLLRLVYKALRQNKNAL